MIKLGLVQTVSYPSDKIALKRISSLLENLGKKETDIVCLPEQWLKDNRISDFDSVFKTFKIIAKNYSMTIIPGAFYQQKPKQDRYNRNR